MRSSKILVAFGPTTLAFAFLLLFACGDDDSGSTPNKDSGGADTNVSADQSAVDSGIDVRDARPEIRCTRSEFDQGDFTDGGADAASTVEIVFNTGANPIQYTNRCSKIRAGGKVTFKGSFLQHPLEPAGGDEPTPITTVDKDQPNNTLTIEFPKAGTYGFQCLFHPLAMFGAIQVVP